ncbi:hypothetical protein [Flavobacterium piscis]|uniref:TIGR02594 family protein n=1 Tax=Flavobacterium piscis TaxID=1114874 RepID=A0ABU1YDF9_9FLAO|nr:hypothetical protein [Flavobacterium piscis]MDR7212203.1 hypothetical protein [Flavobacterium piscis]
MVDLEMAEVQTSKVCVCKENNFYWSSRISCDERKKVLEVCAGLWGETKKVEKASELMSIFHLETASSFSPSIENGKGYVGLIQFNEEAAKTIGTTYAKLKIMTFIDQLDYVKKYLEKNKDKLSSLTDFYLQVIKPNAVGNGNNPDYIVFDESISVPDNGIESDLEKRKKNITREPWVTKYGYASNAPFMKEEGEFNNKRNAWHYTSQKNVERRGFTNGKTTVKEITQVVTELHYDIGKNEIFRGSCKNVANVELFGKAPWFIVALQEFEAYKGLIEKESPLKEKISIYFDVSSAKGVKNKNKENYGYNEPWCGAFLAWCFDQTDNFKRINTKHSAAAFGWKSTNWEKGEDCEAFIGAIIVFDYSHVAIIAGETLDGSGYVYLGGNQGNGDLRVNYQKIIMGSVSKNSKSIIAITKPKDYNISKEEKILQKYDINAENSKESSR